MTYERTESGAIQTTIPVEGTTHLLVMRASNVRKERTGVHATITIGVDSMILEEDTFNVERREDRTRLGNASLKNPIIADLAPRLKIIVDHELLLFLRGLWDFEVGKNEPAARGGSLERTAPPWLLKPYLLQKSGTILFGPPGRGKSWTAYAMAVMLDSGYGFFYDVPTEGAPAMIVNLERSAESVDARLGDINATLGLARDRAVLRLDRRGRKFQDVADSVARIVDREGVTLVVLDSLSRAGYGDLNANEDTNRGMDALNALNTGWLAIGHTPRGDETHLFGSQMQDAAADVMVQLLSEERVDQFGKIILGVGVKGMKANDVRRPPLTILAYEFDEIGLTAIRKGRPGEFLTIENVSASMDVRGQVATYLKAEGEATATAIARDTGIARSTISTLLSNGPEFDKERRGKSVVYRLREGHVSNLDTFDNTFTKDVSKDVSLKDDNMFEAPVENVSNGVEHDTYPFNDDPERIDSLAGL